jgi:hypothetical protein
MAPSHLVDNIDGEGATRDESLVVFDQLCQRLLQGQHLHLGGTVLVVFDKKKAVFRIYDFFWCGSGSADPCLRLMDPDPAIFVTDLQDANKKLM